MLVTAASLVNPWLVSPQYRTRIPHPCLQATDSTDLSLPTRLALGGGVPTLQLRVAARGTWPVLLGLLNSELLETLL